MAAVEVRCSGVLIGTEQGPCHVPVDVVLCYDPADPYAVRMEFPDGTKNPAVWVFARELLDTTSLPRGDGDVHVRPWPGNTVSIGIAVPGGFGAVTISAEAKAQFLTEAYRLVPAGREHEYLDVDLELVRLLGVGRHRHPDDKDLCPDPLLHASLLAAGEPRDPWRCTVCGLAKVKPTMEET